VTAVVRRVTAVAVGAAMGALAFLVMIQGSFHEGYTDLDFNHVLGTMIRGSAEEQRGGDAFGVVGDTAGPTGLYATLLGAGVLLLIHALVIVPLVRRHWVVRGLVLGAVTALVVGVGFCAVADARFDTPVGIFGVDAGGFTPVVIVLCSLGFGLVASRCFSLISSPEWWEVREEDVEAVIESVAELEPAGASSLELAEQGGEERRVSP
jgi:hypothetical protein